MKDKQDIQKKIEEEKSLRNLCKLIQEEHRNKSICIEEKDVRSIAKKKQKIEEVERILRELLEEKEV